MRWLGKHFSFGWDRLTVLECAIACLCALLVPFSRHAWARELGPFELIQAGIIIAGGIQAWRAGRDQSLSPDWRRFWNWSVWCWVLVLGRTVNWGRIFFDPSYPRIWFRLIGAALVAGMTLHFFRGEVYKMAWRLVTRAAWPFWILLIGLLAFIAVDLFEQGRYGIPVTMAVREIVEESMEIVVFAALLLVARFLIVGTRSLTTAQHAEGAA